mmetsp:Transcript_162829/g.312742  ORF Transcript_162829/g.312742 Transcript_162829/m.312742 type:complete len:1320 (-) Transcript_162829:88-4047(-)
MQEPAGILQFLANSRAILDQQEAPRDVAHRGQRPIGSPRSRGLRSPGFTRRLRGKQSVRSPPFRSHCPAVQVEGHSDQASIEPVMQEAGSSSSQREEVAASSSSRREVVGRKKVLRKEPEQLNPVFPSQESNTAPSSPPKVPRLRRLRPLSAGIFGQEDEGQKEQEHLEDHRKCDDTALQQKQAAGHTRGHVNSTKEEEDRRREQEQARLEMAMRRQHGNVQQSRVKHKRTVVESDDEDTETQPSRKKPVRIWGKRPIGAPIIADKRSTQRPDDDPGASTAQESLGNVTDRVAKQHCPERSEPTMWVRSPQHQHSQSPKHQPRASALGKSSSPIGAKQGRRLQYLRSTSLQEVLARLDTEEHSGVEAPAGQPRQHGQDRVAWSSREAWQGEVGAEEDADLPDDEDTLRARISEAQARLAAYESQKDAEEQSHVQDGLDDDLYRYPRVTEESTEDHNDFHFPDIEAEEHVPEKPAEAHSNETFQSSCPREDCTGTETALQDVGVPEAAAEPSKYAIALFEILTERLKPRPLEWDGADILVDACVRIKEPYSTVSCFAGPDDMEQRLLKQVQNRLAFARANLKHPEEKKQSAGGREGSHTVSALRKPHPALKSKSSEASVAGSCTQSVNSKQTSPPGMLRQDDMAAGKPVPPGMFCRDDLAAGKPVPSRAPELQNGKRDGPESAFDKKRKQMGSSEARASADVTLRPKVNRFAEVWSEKQKQVDKGGGFSVDMRYSAAPGNGSGLTAVASENIVKDVALDWLDDKANVQQKQDNALEWFNEQVRKEELNEELLSTIDIVRTEKGALGRWCHPVVAVPHGKPTQAPEMSLMSRAVHNGSRTSRQRSAKQRSQKSFDSLSSSSGSNSSSSSSSDSSSDESSYSKASTPSHKRQKTNLAKAKLLQAQLLQQQQQWQLQQRQKQQQLLQREDEQQAQQQRLLDMQRHRQQLLRQQQQQRDTEDRMKMLQLQRQQLQLRTQQELRHQQQAQEQRQQDLASEEEALSLLQPRLQKRVREMEQVSKQLEVSQQRASDWLRAQEREASRDLELLAPHAHLQPTQAHMPQLALLDDGHRLLRHGGASGSSTMTVDASFCSPRCKAGQGVCVGSAHGGAVSGPARCLCEQHFTGPACEVVIAGDAKQRHVLGLALPQTVAHVWKQHNPALAGLLLEAPISMVVNACGVLIVLVASMLGCWSLGKMRQGHPETERYLHPAAAQRSHIRGQHSGGYVSTSRQQSTFFRYPGADSQTCYTAEGAPDAHRQSLDARRVANGHQEALKRGPAPISAKASQQYIQDVPEYLDDDPEDFGGDGFIDDDYEEYVYHRGN